MHAHPDHSAPNADPFRLLIAASDRRMAAALRALLEAPGQYLVVGEARTAKQAVVLDLALRPSLVLLDLFLPLAADGLEALRLLTLANTRPVVVISAQAGLRRVALADGAAAFLEQGASADVVLATIRAVTLW